MNPDEIICETEEIEIPESEVAPVDLENSAIEGEDA